MIMKIASIIPSLIALLLGVAGGYLIGKQGDAGNAADRSDEIQSGRSELVSGSLTGTSTSSGANNKPSKSSITESGNELVERAKKLIEAGDVSLALKEILNAPGQMERMEALLKLVKGLDSSEVELALAEVRGMGRGMDQYMSMNLLMGRYAEIDPEKALSFVAQSSGMERMMGTSSILRTWASSDPKAAADYLANNVLNSAGDEWQHRRTAGSVASEWARQDPDAALAWAKSLPEEVRGDALGNIIEQLTSEDPLKAAGVAMSFEGEERERSFRTIADQWSRNEPQEAVKWAESLNGEGRAGAMEEALENWVTKDTESTVAYLDKMETSERDEIMSEVVEHWARIDAASAADAANWVAQQPQGEGKVDATGEAVGAWMRADAEAASTWLGEQPAGDAKDRGIAALLRDRSVREDPQVAVLWADSISDEKMRGEQVSRSTRSWLANDRAAALEYLDTTESLSVEQKTGLINLTPEQLQRDSRRDAWRGRGRPF